MTKFLRVPCRLGLRNFEELEAHCTPNVSAIVAQLVPAAEIH